MDITKTTSSMWKYKPIPQDVEPHSEYDSQYAVLSGGKIIGARCRGKKHKHEGTNCDDWFEIGFYDDWTIIAVADGAGSKKMSRIGAKTSSQACVEFITNEISQFDSYRKEFLESLSMPLNTPQCSEAIGYIAGIIQKSVNFALKKLEKKIKNFPNYNLSDFSSTLLIALIIPIINDVKDTKDKKISKELKNISNENFIITLQIGDGAIGAIDTNMDFENSARVLSSPDKGGFAGETEFITAPKMRNLNELMSRTRVYRGTANTVFIMTDGVSDDYFPFDEGIKRLYLDLLANMIFTNRKRISNNDIPSAKFIPRPTAYPWVNDPTVKVSLQYCNEISRSINKPISYIWDNQGILSYYTRYVTTAQIKDKGERLLSWLDNYTERGSFDDRTLVILQL